MIVRETTDQERLEMQRVDAARRRAASALAWTDVIDRRRPEPEAAEPAPLTTAEVAECACPEFCERDHEID